MGVTISNLRTAPSIDAVRADIRSLRKKYKISQMDLSERVGISQPYLSNIEKGTAKEVPFSVVAAIMNELGLEIFIGTIENNSI